MDGGTVWNTNLISAVDKCLEIVDDKSKIVVDIAICGMHPALEVLNTTSNTIGNFLRYRSIRKYFNNFNDILEF